MRVQPPSPLRPASITVMQSAFTRWNRGQHPGGVLQAPLAQRIARPASTRDSRGSIPRRRTHVHAPLGKLVIPSGPQPGDCEFDPRTEHCHCRGPRLASRGRPAQSSNRPGLCPTIGSGTRRPGRHGPIVYGLRSRPFKSRNGVRLPVGLQRGRGVRSSSRPS